MVAAYVHLRAVTACPHVAVVALTPIAEAQLNVIVSATRFALWMHVLVDLFVHKTSIYYPFSKKKYLSVLTLSIVVLSLSANSANIGGNDAGGDPTLYVR